MERDPMKTQFSLVILFVLFISGCMTQPQSTITPTSEVSPAATITQTSSPTETTIPTETAFSSSTAVVSATTLPTIEIGPPNTLDPSAKIPDITEIHMTSKTSGWAYASSEDNVLVLHTSDGGTSWRDVTPPFESWSAHIGQNEFYFPRLGEGFFLDEHRAWISTLRIDKRRPQDPFYAYTANAMLFTADGGATWQMSTLPPGGSGVGYGRFIDFINPMHGWFAVYGHPGAGAGYKGIYMTRDGGESWEIVLDTLGTPSGSYDCCDLAFGDTTTGFFTVNQIGWGVHLYIIWTQDGGKTWQGQDIPEPEDPSTSDPSISSFECGASFPHAFSKLEVAFLVECRMLKDTGSNTNKYHIQQLHILNSRRWKKLGIVSPAPSGRSSPSQS